VFFYASGPPAGVSAASLMQVWLVPKGESATARPVSARVGSVVTALEGLPVPLPKSAVRSPGQEQTPLASEEAAEAEAMAERR
jgi:hypothetical protein